MDHLKFDAPKFQRKELNRVRLDDNTPHSRKTISGVEETNESRDRAIKKQINNEGIFILYHVANLFLSTDYEKCYKVCSINFTFISNSQLFESNFLRFKGLALEQIFLKHTADDKDESLPDIDSITKMRLILDAIEAVQNSIKISQSRETTV